MRILAFITIINPGSGYTEVPTISIAGNATAVAQLVPSEVASTVITNPGFGYTLAPRAIVETIDPSIENTGVIENIKGFW